MIHLASQLICRETANGNCKTLRNDEIIQYFCHEHRNNGNLIQNPLDKEAGIALFILKKKLNQAICKLH